MTNALGSRCQIGLTKQRYVHICVCIYVHEGDDTCLGGACAANAYIETECQIGGRVQFVGGGGGGPQKMVSHSVTDRFVSPERETTYARVCFCSVSILCWK